MYVCICHAVTDREIQYAVRDGVLTFEQLRQQLGVSTGCGRCEQHARHVFRRALREELLPAMPLGVILPDPAAA